MRRQQASTFNGLRQLVCTSICHYLTLLFKFRSVKKGQFGARKANDRLGRKPHLAAILSNQICQLPSLELPPNPAIQALFQLPFTLPFMPTLTPVQTEVRSTIDVCNPTVETCFELKPIACIKSEISFPPD
jgi:hypothetical protein